LSAFTRSFWAIAACILLAIPLSCGSNSQGEAASFEFTAAIVRAANGRVLVTGRAAVPDGTWIHVETIADPKNFNAPFAEAFPVMSGAFVAQTPFSAPLSYKVTAVLTPKLNPALAGRIAQWAGRPGMTTRELKDGKEIVVETSADFGTARDRDEALRNFSANMGKWLESFREDFEKIKDGALTDAPGWYKGFASHKKSLLAESDFVYAPDLAADMNVLATDLDALFRMHLETMQGTAPAPEKRGALVEKIERRLADAAHRLAPEGAPDK
jgi:hypothetical protein